MSLKETKEELEFYLKKLEEQNMIVELEIVRKVAKSLYLTRR